MTRTLTVSDKGLRLIKAFEGFRPEDSRLVTGIRVVGYGHRLEEDETLEVTRSEAEELLLDDLLDYEELVNDEVHAPLSQGQFDALVSLAFNIGMDAFRRSEIVHALNNGRILDAANGFDVWRQATIGDKTYVVDALLRRRTAEKYLFLQTDGALPAPSAMLIPTVDTEAPAERVQNLIPNVSADDIARLDAATVDGTLVAEAEENVETDEPVLVLSDLAEPTSEEEVVEQEVDSALVLDAEAETEAREEDAKETLDLTDQLEADPSQEDETLEPVSPITAAADSLGERLNALLDTDEDEAEKSQEELNWPTSLIEPDKVEANLVTQDEAEPRSNLLSFPTPQRVMTEEVVEETVMPDAETTEGDVLVIDNLAADDVIRASREPDEASEPEGDPVENAMRYLESKQEAEEIRKGGGLWIPLVIGAGLVGASGVLIGRGATELLNTWGPVAAATGAITGALMVLFAIYAAMRGRFV